MPTEKKHESKRSVDPCENGKPRFRLEWDENGIEFRIEGSLVGGMTRWLRWLALVAVITGAVVGVLKGLF